MLRKPTISKAGGGGRKWQVSKRKGVKDTVAAEAPLPLTSSKTRRRLSFYARASTGATGNHLPGHGRSQPAMEASALEAEGSADRDGGSKVTARGPQCLCAFVRAVPLAQTPFHASSPHCLPIEILLGSPPPEGPP